MQIGMIGLGRMGANMVQRLMNDGHECVVFDINAAAVANLAVQGAVGAHSLEEFIAQLSKPRSIWLMLPAAIVDQELTALAPLLEAGDIVIDGGNSFYRDDIRRAAERSRLPFLSLIEPIRNPVPQRLFHQNAVESRGGWGRDIGNGHHAAHAL